MKPITTTFVLLTALSLGTGAALAKGGQDNFERQQELQAQFEQASKDRTTSEGPSLFDRLFASDVQEEAAQPNGTKAGKQAE